RARRAHRSAHRFPIEDRPAAVAEGRSSATQAGYLAGAEAARLAAEHDARVGAEHDHSRCRPPPATRRRDIGGERVECREVSPRGSERTMSAWIDRDTCILVTGGAGFIGSHLANTLVERGYTVRALDSLKPQVHGADAQWPAYLRPEVRRPLRIGAVHLRLQAVERAHGVASLDQRVGEMRANETGAAGDENARIAIDPGAHSAFAPARRDFAALDALATNVSSPRCRRRSTSRMVMFSPDSSVVLG